MRELASLFEIEGSMKEVAKKAAEELELSFEEGASTKERIETAFAAAFQ